MNITRIKLCRFASGLLQTELAKRADLSCRRLADIESGMVRPALEELDRLAAALGVPGDQLIDEAAAASIARRFAPSFAAR